MKYIFKEKKLKIDMKRIIKLSKDLSIKSSMENTVDSEFKTSYIINKN